MAWRVRLRGVKRARAAGRNANLRPAARRPRPAIGPLEPGHDNAFADRLPMPVTASSSASAGRRQPGGRQAALILIVYAKGVTLQPKLKCPNPKGVLTDGKVRKLMPCMKPTCPSCSRILKARLLDKVRQGFDALDTSGHHSYLMTLTLGNYVGRRKIGGKRKKVKGKNSEMGFYFSRFRAYLAKPRLYYGEYIYFRKLKYFKVSELQERGAIHFHVIVDQWIPKDILQAAWEWATYETSMIVDIRSADALYNTAGYMSKYMTKNFDDIKEIRKSGVSRYSMSKYWKWLYLDTENVLESIEKYMPRQPSRWRFELDPWEQGLLESGVK